MTADARLHATHDPELVAAYAAGDASGSDLVAAEGLVAGCTECAALHRDLRAIMTALPRLPMPARTRDFRLTQAQADAIGPSRLRRLLAPLAGARFAFAGPAGAGLAALGLAGILLSGGLNVQPPGASTANTAGGAPETSGSNRTGSQGFAAAQSAGPSGQAAVVDQAAVSAAPSSAASTPTSVKGPAGVAPPEPTSSPKDAIRPAATVPAPSLNNVANFGPANGAGSGEGASVAPQAPAPSNASAAAPPAPGAPTTSPVAELGLGLLAAGFLLAAMRWAARRFA